MQRLTNSVRWLAAMILLGLAQPAMAQAVHRIVAVGDLHGDFAAWRAIARASGLIDATGRWCGGATVFVQTGDVVDRGPDSLPILHDLMRLQREARRAGGRVVALVGNHEAMNVTGDLRYVSAGDYAAFADAASPERRAAAFRADRAAIEAAYRARDPALAKGAIEQAWLAATPLGQVEHRAAWSPSGRIGRWIVANPVVVLIDGNLFVHGGIGASYAKLSLAEINRRVAAALRAQLTNPDAIINDEAGPLWYRGLVSPAAPGTAAWELDTVLQAYGAMRMVIGHTPILSGIAVLEGGRLVRIDTGISAVFGGTLGYLEIVDGRLAPHAVARPAQAGG